MCSGAAEPIGFGLRAGDEAVSVGCCLESFPSWPVEKEDAQDSDLCNNMYGSGKYKPNGTQFSPSHII